MSIGAIVVSLAAAGALTTAEPGTWSSKAAYLWPGPTAIEDFPPGGRHLSVRSPDGRWVARVDDSEIRITGAAWSGLPLTLRAASLAELLWSPNSDAFAITSSDGGWVGTWSVTVYKLSATGLTSSRPTASVLADFKQRFAKCAEEYPNLAAVDWLAGSRELAVVVEMPCHSSCSDMCRFNGYVIDPASGAIFRRLTEYEVRHEWAGAIGPRLESTP